METFPSYPSQLGLIVPPASNLTLSLSSRPSFNPLSIDPFLSSAFLCPLLSLHFHYSMYVQGAVTAWDRGEAPLQEELRDSHNERRESGQSGLHIAAGEGLPTGVWPHPDSGEWALGKLTAPQNTHQRPLWWKKRVLRRWGTITVQPRQQKQNWTLACENILDELLWNQRRYMKEKNIFNQDLTNILCKKKRKSCDK